MMLGEVKSKHFLQLIFASLKPKQQDDDNHLIYTCAIEPVQQNQI